MAAEVDCAAHERSRQPLPPHQADWGGGTFVPEVGSSLPLTPSRQIPDMHCRRRRTNASSMTNVTRQGGGQHSHTLRWRWCHFLWPFGFWLTISRLPLKLAPGTCAVPPRSALLLALQV